MCSVQFIHSADIYWTWTRCQAWHKLCFQKAACVKEMTTPVLSGQSSLMEDINKGMIKTEQSKNLVTSTMMDISTDWRTGEWEVKFNAGGAGMLQKWCNVELELEKYNFASYRDVDKNFRRGEQKMRRHRSSMFSETWEIWVILEWWSGMK